MFTVERKNPLYTAIISKKELNGLSIPVTLDGEYFRIELVPVTKEEADKEEFKSLKGVAGTFLTRESVREDRLKDAGIIG